MTKERKYVLCDDLVNFSKEEAIEIVIQSIGMVAIHCNICGKHHVISDSETLAVKVTVPQDKFIETCLCDQDRVVQRDGYVYLFTAEENCKECQRLKRIYE